MTHENPRARDLNSAPHNGYLGTTLVELCTSSRPIHDGAFDHRFWRDPSRCLCIPFYSQNNQSDPLPRVFTYSFEPSMSSILLSLGQTLHCILLLRYKPGVKLFLAQLQTWGLQASLHSTKAAHQGELSKSGRSRLPEEDTYFPFIVQASAIPTSFHILASILIISSSQSLQTKHIHYD